VPIISEHRMQGREFNVGNGRTIVLEEGSVYDLDYKADLMVVPNPDLLIWVFPKVMPLTDFSLNGSKTKKDLLIIPYGVDKNGSNEEILYLDIKYQDKKEVFFIETYGINQDGSNKEGLNPNIKTEDESDKKRIYPNIKIVAERTKKSLEKAKELEYTSIGFEDLTKNVFQDLGTGKTEKIFIDNVVSAMLGESLEYLIKENTLERIALILDSHKSYVQAERVAERVLSDYK